MKENLTFSDTLNGGAGWFLPDLPLLKRRLTMNTETNMFEDVAPEVVKKNPSKYIEFKIGEGVVIKGYYFFVDAIIVSENSLILKPVGLVEQVKEKEN